MFYTDISTDKEALDVVSRGVEKLYGAVAVTLGPRGRNVVIRKHNARTAVTHDGVTVARSIKLQNKGEEAAAEVLREAASKMEAVTGDGTTTVTVLTHHILKNMRKSKINPMALQGYLRDMEEYIVEKIKDCRIKPDWQTVVDAASVAAGSTDVGRDVGDLIYNAGHKTPVVLGFSDTEETIIEEIDGIKIPSGAASPYLQDPSGAPVELEGGLMVAIVDAKLRDKAEIIPLLSLLAGIPAEDRRILIVATDISGDALALCVMNKLKGFAQIAVARVPYGIHSPTEYLSDIALATGATLLSTNTDASIKQPTMEHLGRADRVVVSQGETLIVGGKHNEKDMAKRKASLEKIESTKAGMAKKFAQDRLATLNQKVISIMVGGVSGTEAEEKHYRYDDSIGAAKATMRSGAVPGGGTLLYTIGKTLPNNKLNKLFAKALKAPLETILGNAGVRVPRGIGIGLGVDVRAPEMGLVNLVGQGIVDPMESEIECVRTAISAAALLLTTGAVVTDEVVDEKTE